MWCEQHSEALIEALTFGRAEMLDEQFVTASKRFERPVDVVTTFARQRDFNVSRIRW